MMKNKRQIIFFAFLLFNLFGFKFIEPYIIPPVQAWILNSGPMAAVYYFLAGLFSVIVAPFTLGPIHTILQKSFGFWTSFGLFYGFTTLGQYINFLIARSYGPKLVNRFFPQINNNPIYVWLKSNLNRSFLDVALINIGFGNDFMAYIFGLSKVNFLKFAGTLGLVNLFTTFVFVSRNLAVGDTFGYLFWFLSSYFITFVPLLIVFRKDLPSLFKKLKDATKNSIEAQEQFAQHESDFKNKKISKEEFEIIKKNHEARLSNPLTSIFMDKVE